MGFARRGWSQLHRRERGQLILTAPSSFTLTNADEYYTIPGAFADGFNLGIETSVDGVMTYTGFGNIMRIVGVSDLEVDRACEITYAFFREGLLVPGAQTPHGFVSPSKTANISITAIMEAAKNNYMSVRVKSDVAGTVVNIRTLVVTAVEV